MQTRAASKSTSSVSSSSAAAPQSAANLDAVKKLTRITSGETISLSPMADFNKSFQSGLIEANPRKQLPQLPQSKQSIAAPSRPAPLAPVISPVLKSQSSASSDNSHDLPMRKTKSAGNIMTDDEEEDVRRTSRSNSRRSSEARAIKPLPPLPQGGVDDQDSAYNVGSRTSSRSVVKSVTFNSEDNSSKFTFNVADGSASPDQRHVKKRRMSNPESPRDLNELTANKSQLAASGLPSSTRKLSDKRKSLGVVKTPQGAETACGGGERIQRSSSVAPKLKNNPNNIPSNVHYYSQSAAKLEQKDDDAEKLASIEDFERKNGAKSQPVSVRKKKPGIFKRIASVFIPKKKTLAKQESKDDLDMDFKDQDEYDPKNATFAGNVAALGNVSAKENRKMISTAPMSSLEIMRQAALTNNFAGTDMVESTTMSSVIPGRKLKNGNEDNKIMNTTSPLNKTMATPSVSSSNKSKQTPSSSKSKHVRNNSDGGNETDVIKNLRKKREKELMDD